MAPAAATVADVRAALGTVLGSLTEAGLIDRWWQTVYEPEVYAFGGPAGMDIAHTQTTLTAGLSWTTCAASTPPRR